MRTNLRRFFLLAHKAACSALAEHLVRHRWLFESGSAFVFLKNTGAFVLFLEPAQCAVNGFVFLNYNSYHSCLFSLKNLVGR